MFVKTWMTPDPITVEPTTPLKAALKRMDEGKFRRFPVVQAGQLAGIVTRAEIELGLASIPVKFRVQDVMKRGPLTVIPDEPIESAAHKMCANKIAALPVMEGGRLVGIITESDIFYAFSRIMGGGLPGARITFDLEPGPHEIPSILELVRKHGAELFSIATFEHYDSDRRWVTLRLRGSHLDDLIGALWDAKYRVLQVLVDDLPRHRP